MSPFRSAVELTVLEYIEHEQVKHRLVELNMELIARIEQKIQAKLAEIWGDSAEVTA